MAKLLAALFLEMSEEDAEGLAGSIRMQTQGYAGHRFVTAFEQDDEEKDGAPIDGQFHCYLSMCPHLITRCELCQDITMILNPKLMMVDVYRSTHTRIVGQGPATQHCTSHCTEMMCKELI